MHFFVQLLARKRRPLRRLRLVVIHPLQPPIRVKRLHPRPHPLAERAPAIHVDLVFRPSAHFRPEISPATQYNPTVASAVEQFEREFALWLGVPHVLATAYGRTAAWLAFSSLCLKPENEILLPNFICRQILDAARLAGLVLRFYPVSRDLIIRPTDILAAATPATRAVLVPHYFGHTQPPIAEIIRACDDTGITVIEDCALALGARTSNGRLAGTYAAAAIFSFTKSDWCYGGGALACRDLTLLNRAQALYSSKSTGQSQLSFTYGLLRRLDYLANRPSRSMFAEFRGRLLQQSSGLGDADFYDAAPIEAAVTPLSARRAARILKSLGKKIIRRREIRAQILSSLPKSLQSSSAAFIAPHDSASHLILPCHEGRAEHWAEEAAREGITLRRTWPVHQTLEPGQHSPDLDWLSASLLILEIHPGLTKEEIACISTCLGKLEKI